ncbi:MAG: hypothetical protein EOO01_42520, partial [Chitinophagaceae bacterium]
MNEDFYSFKKDNPYFFSERDKVVFTGNGAGIRGSLQFQNTFPILSQLLAQSRVLYFSVNGHDYRLVSWTKKDNQSCGWLNKAGDGSFANLNLIDEHQILLRELGGIEESYNPPESSLSNNQTFMFTGDR